MPYQAYTDGGCIQNPGNVGTYGFWIDRLDISDYGLILGYRITNNLAEYTGLHELLKQARNSNVSQLKIHADSRLIVKVVNQDWGYHKGQWNPHHNFPRLNFLATQCYKMIKQDGHTIQWIPREQNRKADELAERALTNSLFYEENATRPI